MLHLIYDIETVANERAKLFYDNKEYTTKLSPVTNPPATITKLKNLELRNERLADWKKEQEQKIKDDIKAQRDKDEARSGLHWITGKVAMIGASNGDKSWCFYGKDEKKILCDFFQLLEDTYEANSNFNLVGKNSEDFDRPFLIGRALVHNIGLPRLWKRESLRDVNEIFSYRANCSQLASLDKYAFGLGIDGKSGKATEVQSWYDADLFEDMKHYCLRDVFITNELYERGTKTFARNIEPMNESEVPF